jgi:hypothetical protein
VGIELRGNLQDVYLEYHPDRARIAEVGISTPVRGGVRLNLTAGVDNHSSSARNLKLRFTVLDKGQAVATLSTDSRSIAPGETAAWTLGQAMPNVKLWGVGGKYGSPYLYTLQTELLDGARVIDRKYDSFGFSQLWIEKNKFFLNGQPLFLAGGGIWYLQEGKYPLGNRFYMANLFRWDRMANLNIERFHRQGDVADSIFAEASAMGMLMESEVSATSFSTAPEDFAGRCDFQDPIWLKNIKSYYRDWAAKHRNWPCLGLSSIENETFSYYEDEETMQTGMAMAKIIQEVDPLRLYDLHGNHMMAGHPGPKFVNVHYVEGRALNTYEKQLKGRPIINGEHNMGGEALSNNHDRKVAAQGEKNLAGFWRQNIRDFRTFGAGGLFVFVPAFQAYCTTSDWRKTTPWGDLFKDLSKFNPGDDHWQCNFNVAVDIPWPSLSGPDCKAEKLGVGATTGTLNWFDPNRPVTDSDRLPKFL